jgi:Leucine Rich repeat
VQNAVVPKVVALRYTDHLVFTYATCYNCKYRGVTPLAAACRRRLTLLHISLSWNDLGAKGGSVLAPAVLRSGSNGLVALELSFNGLTDEVSFKWMQFYSCCVELLCCVHLLL